MRSRRSNKAALVSLCSRQQDVSAHIISWCSAKVHALACMPPKAKPDRKDDRLSSCVSAKPFSTAAPADIAARTTIDAVRGTEDTFMSRSGMTLQQQAVVGLSVTRLAAHCHAGFCALPALQPPLT